MSTAPGLDLEYGIDLDHRVWVPVPLTFPWNDYTDAATWSGDVASSLLSGFDAPADVVAALQRSALAMAETEGPFPGAVERFWHFPVEGGSERLAHLYIAEYPEPGESAARAIATAGIGGYVQVIERVDDTAFEQSWRTVVIAEPETGDRQPIFVARFIGFVGGIVFLVETVDSNAIVLQELLEPLETLFRAIELREPGATEA